MANDQGIYDTQAAKESGLETISTMMHEMGVSDIYIKKLAPNDNSNNQSYF